MLRPYESAWARIFGRRRRSSAARLSRAVQMSLQPLEPRQLLSASLVSGQLDISETVGADRIVVRLQPGNSSKLKVNDDGLISHFAVSSVNQIDISGAGGADYIDINDANGPIDVPANIRGRGGDDTILGGSGADTLRAGGGANFLQSGGDAASVLRGGANADTLVGSAQDDIIAGSPRDLISTNLGASFSLQTPSSVSTVSVPTSVASTLLTVKPDYVINDGGTSAPIANGNNGVINPFVVGYTPQEIRAAYGFGVIGAPGTTDLGQGQTIGIIDFGDNPTVLTDLTNFSKQFGLPLPTPQTFQKVFANGAAPSVDPDFGVEIDLDVEWAHVIAPDAKIVLVEGDNTTSSETEAMVSNAQLIQAVEVAGNLVGNGPAGGGVVSMSFGTIEAQGGETIGGETVLPVAIDGPSDFAADAAFAAFPNVSFLASSGDTAIVDPPDYPVSYPSTSPYVTSVGGTMLTLDSNGARSPALPETTWVGTSGGISTVEPEPAYQQQGIGQYINTPELGEQVGRLTPDVAFLSETAVGGVAELDSTPNPAGDAGWQAVGGTSLACPMFAATVALANQSRVDAGEPVIGGSLNNAIYNLVANNNFSGSGHQDFTPIMLNAVNGTEQISVPSGNPPLPADYTFGAGFGTPIPTNFISDVTALGLTGSTPPVQNVYVNIDDIVASATEYSDFSTPLKGTNAAFDSFQGTGSAVSTGPSAISVTLSLNDDLGDNLPAAINIAANTAFNLTTGYFSGVGDEVPTGTPDQFQGIFVEGTISNDGQSISGDFQTVSIDAAGNITPIGKSGQIFLQAFGFSGDTQGDFHN